jgi:hypothetical protein
MKPSRSLLAALLLLFLLSLVATSTPASADEVRITVTPPALRTEVRGTRPGPYHVWQAGSWAWHPEGRYIWHPGRWVLPPEGRTVWVRDEWIRYAGSWQLVPGHWRAVGETIPTVTQRVNVTVEPPAEQVEAPMTGPEGQTWIRGHWSWDGARYVWTPGHLMVVPEGFHAWEAGHWYAAGGHWFYRGGYWR